MADVLVYDYLSNAEFLRMAKPGSERIYAGKKAKDHTLTQDQINALIVAKAKEGKIVTRLKGGDPVLFGRGAEEAAENFPCEFKTPLINAANEIKRI